MKKVLIAVFAALALSGCALMQKAPLVDVQLAVCKAAPAGLTATCNEAVDILEKSSILLASINDAVDHQSFIAKTMSREDALVWRANTKAADAKLDDVATALNKFDYTNALTQANLTKLLIETLNEELAKQVAKGAK